MNSSDLESRCAASRAQHHPLLGDLLEGLKSLALGLVVFLVLGLVVALFGDWLSCSELPASLRCSPGLF